MIITEESTIEKPSNRRRYERHSVDQMAHVRLIDDDDEDHNSDTACSLIVKLAFVDDISLTGLHLLSSALYKREALLWIRLRLGAKSCELKGIVRRSTPATVAGRRCYGYGVQFTRSEQALESLTLIAEYLAAVRKKKN